MMIGLELSMQSDAAHRTELKQTLQQLCGEAVSEGASRECSVFEDLSTPNQFLWLQWWRSQHELQCYLRSAGFRTLLGAIRVLGKLKSARTVELQDSTSLFEAFVGTHIDLSEYSERA